GAIEMNDYLMLGATVGMPALFCFGMYVWVSLTGRATEEFKVQSLKFKVGEPDCSGSPQLTGGVAQSTPDLEVEWLRTVCHAGAIVLLVGFWFDGGLFKLATGSVLWILLELGRDDLAASLRGDVRTRQADAHG